MTDYSELARRLHVADADIRAVTWFNQECYVTLVDGTIRALLEHGYEIVSTIPTREVTEQVTEQVPVGSVNTIVNWVADDPVKAQLAINEELLRDKPRKGLLGQLERIVT
jgi:hypothetical protein